jgi:hypothetical protein
MKVWTSLPGLLDDAAVRPVVGQAYRITGNDGSALGTVTVRFSEPHRLRLQKGTIHDDKSDN